MLQSIYIQNYALIDTLDISFTPGFSVITGETGAGKSIILGALRLILGERADLKAIADAGKKSVVEALQSDISNVKSQIRVEMSKGARQGELRDLYAKVSVLERKRDDVLNY